MTWKVIMRAVLCALVLVQAPVGVSAQTPDRSIDQESVFGDWHGRIVAGAANPRVAMHLGETSTFDSLEEGLRGAAGELAISGRRVTLSVPSIGGVFEGELSEDGAQLRGEWRQLGHSFPLTLERGQAALNRPQTPIAPFPYRAEDVAFQNPQRPDVRLAGTLTIPEGRGRHPAVLLITGSGPQDRNEAVMGHQPFLVLADYLSRRGFAVLRVDDRGVGGSTGATPNDTMHDYVTDTEAGVAYLRSRRDIDARRIALIGHSEGGLIAPLVASSDRRIAGLVLWAGPGVRGAEVMVEQTRAIMESTGTPAEQVETAVQSQRRTMEALNGARDAVSAREAVMAVWRENGAQTEDEAALQAQLSMIASPWFRTFVAYDPAPTLRGLRTPVLALLGEKDVQVLPAQNEPALRAALANNSRARVIVFSGLNHLFQTSTTGAVSEYAEIEETIAPEALQTIGDWLEETLGPHQE
ncbi:MAG: alpha/beta fold hydrolase [Hyphomonadaceae bacterium]|nr:alpha/beta fold hydrolase [Hyphomonadaceae bacterium]